MRKYKQRIAILLFGILLLAFLVWGDYLIAYINFERLRLDWVERNPEKYSEIVDELSRSEAAISLCLKELGTSWIAFQVLERAPNHKLDNELKVIASSEAECRNDKYKVIEANLLLWSRLKDLSCLKKALTHVRDNKFHDEVKAMRIKGILNSRQPQGFRDLALKYGAVEKVFSYIASAVSS